MRRIKKNSLDKIKKIIKREIAALVLKEASENLLKFNAVDTGYLLRSGTIKEEGDKISVFFDCDYASYIEFGTAPHFPPPKAIEGWVNRKLGIKGKRGRKVAYMICWAIAKHGTKPRPFIRNALRDVVSKIKNGKIKIKIR